MLGIPGQYMASVKNENSITNIVYTISKATIMTDVKSLVKN